MIEDIILLWIMFNIMFIIGYYMGRWRGKKGEKSALGETPCKSSNSGVARQNDSKPETHGCFNCRYFLNYDLCNDRDPQSYEEFTYSTFLTAICNNWEERVRDATRMEALEPHREYLKEILEQTPEEHEKEFYEPRQTDKEDRKNE